MNKITSDARSLSQARWTNIPSSSTLSRLLRMWLGVAPMGLVRRDVERGREGGSDLRACSRHGGARDTREESCSERSRNASSLPHFDWGAGLSCCCDTEWLSKDWYWQRAGGPAIIDA
jgi:hypothetical protein